MSDAVDKTTDMAAAYAQQGRDAAGAATNMLSARLSGVAAATGGVALSTHAQNWNVMLEKLGVHTCVTRTGKAVKAVEQQMAKQADRAMIGQVRLMLNKFGAKIKQSIHSAGEPAVLTKVLDNLFGPFWKEVEKSLLDSFILETGFQFKEYRKALKANTAEAPSEPMEWLRATLLHAVEPSDLTFFGKIRIPLYFAIFMTFLFPLYGVDSCCIILFWIAQKKADEFQLCNFIIKSKGLLFITGGLLGSAIAFTKLFRCSTADDPNSPAGCAKKAPGITATFRFEISLFFVRCVLVWVTFGLLYNFDAVEKWAKRREAMRATSDPRRGLFEPKLSFVMVVANWILLVVNLAACAVALNTGTRHGAANVLETFFLNLLFVTFPFNFLVHTVVLLPIPALIAFCLSGGVIAYEGVKVYHSPHDVILAQASVLVSAGYGCVVFLLLAAKQFVAKRADASRLLELTAMIKDLDADGDGEVSKKELKVVFAKMFPGASFEKVWDELDSDGSGSLTTKELAAHFGMAHVVHGTAAEEEAFEQATQKKLKDAGIGGMADIEAQLEELSASELSGTAGGSMTYFLYWDLGCFVAIALFCGSIISRIPTWDDWRVNTTLYFGKIAMGLCAFPFLTFKLPLVTDALTHTRKTAYDGSGACVPKVPGGEIKKRFREKHMKQVLAGEDADGDGKVSCGERIDYAWNALLGPAFTPEDTYKMIRKAYGEKVAAPYRPAPKPRKGLFARAPKGVEKDVLAAERDLLAKDAKAVNMWRKTSTLIKGAASDKAMV